jgi:hypothetical protein
VSLSKVWVLLYDVPVVLRHEAFLLEATKMIGSPRMVDETSLAPPGPVHMLFHSHHPAGIPESVLLFANMQGFKIVLAMETPKGKSLLYLNLLPVTL